MLQPDETDYSAMDAGSLARHVERTEILHLKAGGASHSEVEVVGSARLARGHLTEVIMLHDAAGAGDGPPSMIAFNWRAISAWPASFGWNPSAAK